MARHAQYEEQFFRSKLSRITVKCSKLLVKRKIIPLKYVWPSTNECDGGRDHLSSSAMQNNKLCIADNDINKNSSKTQYSNISRKIVNPFTISDRKNKYIKRNYSRHLFAFIICLLCMCNTYALSLLFREIVIFLRRAMR